MSYSEEVYRRLSSKVKLQAIGNSKRKIRDVAVDLVNASEESWKDIATGCFLSKATVANLAKDKTKNPQSETVERVFRYFGVRMDLDLGPIKAQYENKPKGEK